MYQYGFVTGLLFILVLSGCQGMNDTKKSTVTPQTGRPVTATVVANPAPQSDGVKKQLAICLFEASQLQKLNTSKYQESIKILYTAIREARYYASIAGNMSSGNTDTLTPMYQYMVNDACNAVSQLLLAELKKGGGATQVSN